MLFADHNGTTPMAEDVLAAMVPFLRENWANPSARLTPQGRATAAAIEVARREVANLIEAAPEEISFTGGGSESCFLGLVGCFVDDPRDHLLISAVEHEAIRSAAEFLSKLKPTVTVEVLPVSKTGQIDIDLLLSKIRPGRSVVSLMLANNETGVIFPLANLAPRLRDREVILHADAIQGVGKIPVNVRDLGVDVLSLSAHKFFGPKGVGGLFVRSGYEAWASPMRAGGQEHGRRGGTENAAGIVGCGVAAKLARAALCEAPNRLPINERFERLLQQHCEHPLIINGLGERRLPNTTSVTIEGVLSQDIVIELAKQDIVVSAGSACSAQFSRPSHVLLAMGLNTLQAASTLRISLDPFLSEAAAALQLRPLAEAIVQTVDRLKRNYQEQLAARVS